MENTVAQLQQEIATLTENNEVLLKSKSKLQQEVLLLKRQLITHEKNTKLIGDQETYLSTQNRLLAEKDTEITSLELQHEQARAEIQELKNDVERLNEENARLRNRKWYQLLIGKK